MSTTFLCPLLFLLCLHPVVAGGAGGHWWCDDIKCYHEDYAYVEAIIIVLLVILAVLFEFAHEHLEHLADRSYWYGKLQSVKPESRHDLHAPGVRTIKQRSPLFKHWVNRLSMEFMVLGFLAFFVFVAREAGFFEWVVHAFPHENHHTHLPKSPEDWVHMVENVHMKLFLGMIIYFLNILKVVQGCSKHVEFWEEMRILRRNSRSESSGELSEKSSQTDVLCHTRLRRYGRWRLYFIQSVMNWRETRPKLYEETLRRLTMWAGDTPSQSCFQRTLDEVFPFSAYLAYSVRECCKDTVDIHRITWAAVIVLFTIFALIHRYCKLILLHFMPVFILVAFLLLFCVSRLVRVFRHNVESTGFRAVHSAAAAENSQQTHSFALEGSGDIELGGKTMESQDATEGFHERHATELWVFRMLQIVLFVLSYSCARTVGDANDWQNRPQEVLAVSCGFLVLFIVLGSLLPKYVPNFAALMAMPPFCDQHNVETFFEVLDEYNTQHGTSAQDAQEAKCCGSVSIRPSSFLATPKLRAGSLDENDDGKLELKISCQQFETAMDTLTQQQSQLAGQVQDLQSSLRQISPSKGVPDAARNELGTASIPLNFELGMMRVQLARLEGLMQSRPAGHMEQSPVNTAWENSGSDVGCSPQYGVVKTPSDRWCSNSRDLQFFVDPGAIHSHKLMSMERQCLYAAPTRGANETHTSEQGPSATDVN